MAKDFADISRLTEAAEMNASSKRESVSKMVKAWESKNARRALQGAGLSTMAVTLAACGGSSTTPAPADPTPLPPAASTTVALANNGGVFSLTSTVTGVSLPSSTAATLYINDSATNAQSFKLTADAIGSGKVTFQFADANDVVTLTAGSDLGNIATVEIVGGTVDFTALTDADFNVKTLTVNSAAVVSFDQATELMAVTGKGDIKVTVMSEADIATIVTWMGTTGFRGNVDLVNGTGSTVTAAQLTAGNSSVDAKTTELNKPAPVAPVDQTFALTTAQDVAAKFTGGAGNDTFNAVVTTDKGTGTTIAAGDFLVGGAGTDTLNINVSGTHTGAQTISAVQTDGIEKVFVSNFDLGANLTTTVDATLMTGLTTVGLSASSAEGDTVFTGMKNFVAAEMRNGSGDLTLTYNGAQVVTGTADSQSLTVANVTAGTFTANGIETINITAETAKSTLTAVASDALKTLNISGNQDVKITNAVDFVAGTNDDTTIDATINAKSLTGKLTVTADQNDTKITGGSADDTINMVGLLTKNDIIDGGAGVDTLSMDAATLTTQFAQVKGIETVAFNKSTADAALDVGKLSAGVTTVQMDLQDATDGGNANVTGTISNLDGQKVVLKHTTANAADTDGSDGIAYAITGKTDTDSDSVSIVLDAIGVTSTANNNTSDFGINALDVANFEAISLTSKKSDTVKSNEVKALTDSSAKTITIAGDADLTTTQTGTKLTSINAASFEGKLNITLGANKVNVVGGSKDDTFVFAGNFDNNDSVDGGAGKDTVTATVSSLTATTGAFKLSNVETLSLTSSGTNTIDLTAVSGLSTLKLTQGTNTITGLDLNTGIEVNNATTLKVTGKDVTGSSDTLKVATAISNASNDVVVEGKGIEKLEITVKDTSTDNTADVHGFDVDTFEGTSVKFMQAADSNTAAAVNVDLAGTKLHKNVTSVDAAGLKGTFTASAADATNAVTFQLGGAGVQTVTGGAKADTFNVAETGNVTHVIDGGVGTDIANISIKNGYVTGAQTAVEVINYAVRAGDDVTLTGVNSTTTTTINLAGGNSLSTFTTAANGIVNELKVFDASKFGGNVVLKSTKNIIDDTVTFTGGIATTDEIEYQIDATGTDKLQSTGIEILDLNVDETSTLDLTKASGVKTIDVDVATNKTFTIDKMVGSQLVLLTDAATGGATVEAKLADAAGTFDAISFELKAANAIADGTKIKTTDVETVNLKVSTDESISLADLSMATAGAVMALTVTGDKALTISALNSDVTSINASGMTDGGKLVQTGRSSLEAANYVGSLGDDTFMMLNGNDALNAGAGKGDTLDVNFGAVLGGVKVDLSSSVDQIQSLDGLANTAIQVGFENVDLAGHTGFGSVIVGSDDANRITGTASVDRIDAGKGNDTIVVNTGTVANDDVMNGGEGTDTLEIAAGLTVTIDGDTDLVAIENITFIGAGALVLTGQTEAFSINAKVAGVNTITSGTGADTIELEDAAATDADVVILNSKLTAKKTITGVDSAEDIIKIGGALKTALAGDTAVVEGNLALNAGAGADYAIETAAIGWADEGDQGTLLLADLTDLTKIATALEVAFKFADGGADATLNTEIFVVEADSGTTFGIYAWTQTAIGDATVDAAELLHLATVTSTNLVGADVAILA